MSSAELKALQVRRSKLNDEALSYEKEANELRRRASEARAAISALDKQISALTAKEPVMSEHALLRYIERVHGFDLEKIKADILSPRVVEAIKFVRSGKVPADGMTLVVKDMTVVSVLT